MKHPFESVDGIFGLTLLVALLGAYLYFAVPTGAVEIVPAESMSSGAAAIDGGTQPGTTSPRPKAAVPVAGFFVAVLVGVIALAASVSPFLGDTHAKRRMPHWIGPRSSV